MKTKSKIKLTIELVPRTAWFSNVRSMVSSSDWDILRKECYEIAEHKCEICGGKGNKWPVECHEVWEYDDKNLIQKLIRLISLCPRCHEVKHIGLAQQRGRMDEAIEQLMTVNNWNDDEAFIYIENQIEIWHERSSKQWNIDLSFLDNKNVTYKDDRRIK